MPPTVAAGLVRGFADFAVRHGADRADLLRRADLEPPTVDDPDARVPLSRYLTLIRAAREATGIPSLALRYGEAAPMRVLSVLGLIMEGSATMGDALRQLQRYGRIAADISDGSDDPRMALAAEAGRLFLVYSARRAGMAQELVEIAFAQLTCGPRRFLTRPHVKSVQVRYPAPCYAEEYGRVFGCAVRFDADRNALELEPDVADWPVCATPNYALPALVRQADAMLAAMDGAASMRARVRAVLRPRLSTGSVSAETVAAALGCSRQTLHRRLSREETTFSKVARDVREECARAHLSTGDRSIDDVAFLVGFSEAASFSRAFKRWTGQSPADFRRRRRGAPD